MIQGLCQGLARIRTGRPAPGRVIRHRNKVQDHGFTDKYQEGKAMPSDYVARHGAPNEGRDEEGQERQGNIHGDFHRGQHARGHTRQDAGRQTRERVRGRRRGAGEGAGENREGRGRPDVMTDINVNHHASNGVMCNKIIRKSIDQM